MPHRPRRFEEVVGAAALATWFQSELDFQIDAKVGGDESVAYPTLKNYLAAKLPTCCYLKTPPVESKCD